MAKKKLFKPLIRCGCPVILWDSDKEKSFEKCTCYIISPKTGKRAVELSPRGIFQLLVTSHKHPLWAGREKFKKPR